MFIDEKAVFRKPLHGLKLDRSSWTSGQGVQNSPQEKNVEEEASEQSDKIADNMNAETAKKARRYPRVGIPRGLYVAWSAHGERTVSRVGTIGLGGLFIKTDAPPPIGERLQLVFEVPGGIVRAACIVRDSEPKRGMGVEFTSMNADARSRLSHLLRRLLRD